MLLGESKATNPLNSITRTRIIGRLENSQVNRPVQTNKPAQANECKTSGRQTTRLLSSPGFMENTCRDHRLSLIWV